MNIIDEITIVTFIVIIKIDLSNYSWRSTNGIGSDFCFIDYIDSRSWITDIFCSNNDDAVLLHDLEPKGRNFENFYNFFKWYLEKLDILLRLGSKTNEQW